MNRIQTFPILLLLSCGASFAIAEEKKLQAGSSAPVLAVGEWVKGDPVKEFEKGKIYVVEFWATWCGPCLQSIPHLSELQARFKDKGVVVIGVNCMESAPAKVAGFVEKMGAKMEYRVALDDTRQNDEGRMKTTWLDAAGQTAIPASFVVDREGKIAWIGHPQELDIVLERVVAGTFDPKELAVAKDEAAARAKTQDELNEGLAFIEDGELDSAWTLAETYLAAAPELDNPGLLIQHEVLLKKKDEAGARKIAQKMDEVYRKDADLLAAASRRMAMRAFQSGTGDLNLAEKWALRALDLSGGKSCNVLSVLAGIQMAKEQLDPALKTVADMAALAVATGDEEQLEWARIHTLRLCMMKKDYAAAKAAGEKIVGETKGALTVLIPILLNLTEGSDPAPEALKLAEEMAAQATALTEDAGEKRVLQNLQLIPLMRRGEAEEAARRIEQIYPSETGSPRELILLAKETIDTDPPVAFQVDLAEMYLRRANAITRGEDANVLAEMATFYSEIERWELAVEMQTQAVGKAKEPAHKQKLEEDLEGYREEAQAAGEDGDEEAGLEVGNPAPALTVGEWIKGEPVAAFEKGKIYVLEFWATWCGPCLEQIPHLTQLQEKYRDQGVVIIGVACSERNPAKVPGFVKNMGAKMGYRVATDDVRTNPDGAMFTAWMEAAGLEGIPATFVVDKEGKMAWIGHPSHLAKVLEAMVAGTFDPAKADEWDAGDEEPTEVERLDEARELVDEGKMDLAWSKIEAMGKADPQMAKAAYPLQYRILWAKNDAQGAAALGEKMFTALRDDAGRLTDAAGELAGIAHPEGRTAIDQLVERMARRAMEITPGGHSDALDLLIRMHTKRGKLDRALQTADEALAAAQKEDDDKARFEALFHRMKILRKQKDYGALADCGKQIVEVTKEDAESLESALGLLFYGEEENETPAEEQAILEAMLKQADAVVTQPAVKLRLHLLHLIRELNRKDDAAIRDRIEFVLQIPDVPAATLSEFAELLISDRTPAPAMYALAEKTMRLAVEKTRWQDLTIVLGLAQVFYKQGDWPRTEEILLQAIARAETRKAKSDLRVVLERSKAAIRPPAKPAPKP